MTDHLKLKIVNAFKNHINIFIDTNQDELQELWGDPLSFYTEFYANLVGFKIAEWMTKKVRDNLEHRKELYLELMPLIIDTMTRASESRITYLNAHLHENINETSN